MPKAKRTPKTSLKHKNRLSIVAPSYSREHSFLLHSSNTTALSGKSSVKAHRAKEKMNLLRSHIENLKNDVKSLETLFDERFDEDSLDAYETVFEDFVLRRHVDEDEAVEAHLLRLYEAELFLQQNLNAFIPHLSNLQVSIDALHAQSTHILADVARYGNKAQKEHVQTLQRQMNQVITTVVLGIEGMQGHLYHFHGNIMDVFCRIARDVKLYEQSKNVALQSANSPFTQWLRKKLDNVHDDETVMDITNLLSAIKMTAPNPNPLPDCDFSL